MSGAGVFSSAPAPAKKSGSIILGVTTSHEFEYLHFTENLSFYNKCTVIHFLYSGKCSFHNQTTFTNNSHIPSHRKNFHVKPSERYHPAKVFMLGRTGTYELQMGR